MTPVCRWRVDGLWMTRSATDARRRTLLLVPYSTELADRDPGDLEAVVVDVSDEYDNDSPEQAGRSSPSTMFGPPFWAIRRTCAEKPAAPAATFAKWAPISQISPLITQVFPLVSGAGQPYRPTHPPVPIIAQTVKRHVWPHSWGNQGCHTPFVFLR